MTWEGAGFVLGGYLILLGIATVCVHVFDWIDARAQRQHARTTKLSEACSPWYPNNGGTPAPPPGANVLFWVVRNGAILGPRQYTNDLEDRITHWARIYTPQPTVSTRCHRCNDGAYGSPCPECDRK